MQLRYPEDHRYWNPDTQISKDLASFYYTIHPRAPGLEASGRVAIKAVNEKVLLAPYYGFTALEEIDAVHFVESVLDYNDEEVKGFLSEDKMRRLWHDLVYREFRFEDDDMKDEVYARVGFMNKCQP